jgi:hypothetical protein
MLSLVNGFAASRFTAQSGPLAARWGSLAVQLAAAGIGGGHETCNAPSLDGDYWGSF